MTHEKQKIYLAFLGAIYRIFRLFELLVGKTKSLTNISSSFPPQSVLSCHTLRRVSYATCEPSARLSAFLARDEGSDEAGLHLQRCHVFRSESPEQAEDLNTLIGNAFR